LDIRSSGVQHPMSGVYSQLRTVVSNPNFQLKHIECHRGAERWKKMTKWHSLHSSTALVLGSLHVWRTTLELMVPKKSVEVVSGIPVVHVVHVQLGEVRQTWIQWVAWLKGTV